MALEELIGSDIMIYYSIKYYKEKSSSGYIGTALARGINCAASIASLTFIGKFRRKTLSMLGFSALGLCTTALLVIQHDGTER